MLCNKLQFKVSEYGPWLCGQPGCTKTVNINNVPSLCVCLLQLVFLNKCNDCNDPLLGEFHLTFFVSNTSTYSLTMPLFPSLGLALCSE